MNKIQYIALLTTLLTISFLLLPLFTVSVVHAQGTSAIEERISKLRAEERDLEWFRDELKRDIQKVEYRDKKNRPEYVVLTGAVTGNLQIAGLGYFVISREEMERRIALNVLIGGMTFEQALEYQRKILAHTKAFPVAARGTLNAIEKELAETKKQLLALLSERDRLKSNAKAEDTRAISGGCDDITGSWTNTIPSGSSTWVITREGGGYKAVESGMGGAKSTLVTFSGNTLLIEWVAGGIKGYYEWQLDANCQQSTKGTLVWTQGLSGSRNSTLKRL